MFGQLLKGLSQGINKQVGIAKQGWSDFGSQLKDKIFHTPLKNPQIYDPMEQKSMNLPANFDTSQGTPLLPTKEYLDSIGYGADRGGNNIAPQVAGRQVVQPTPMPSFTPNPTPQPSMAPTTNSAFNWSVLGNWKPKYASQWEQYAPQNHMTPEQVKLLVQSENGQEIPDYQNINYKLKVVGTKPDGKPIYDYVLDAKGQRIPLSVDTGLTQINTPMDAYEEINKLKNPDYGIQRGAQIFGQRLLMLEDPVLALASYNKGAAGAVRDPIGSLNRSRELYAKSQLPLPDTEFTRDPQGYIKKRMSKYAQLGFYN